jgi:hypothetical protein
MLHYYLHKVAEIQMYRFQVTKNGYNFTMKALSVFDRKFELHKFWSAAN